ncbi:hypothetical protein FWJ25_12105 [Marinobacter salinexigens]|uniref:Uncharacterized protein n=3 Tax=Marinobacter TaxID=2742 RepID=A0A5B0VFT4_9GAMM|nr:hypothetical protein FWJ25_12105 [Marinobacter salinexigens]
MGLRPQTGEPHLRDGDNIMGFSRKEVYYWLETASDEQLQAHLRNSQEMLVLLTDREQIKSLKWLRSRIIEEINARKEAKQS